jgi:AraC-like DNA-binding protein
MSNNTGKVNSGGSGGESFANLGILVNLPPLLQSLGCDPVPIIQGAGLDIKIFDNPGNRVSYRGAARLLEISADESKCEHIGLLMGQQYDLAYAGAAGFAALSANNVGDALDTIRKFLALTDEGGSLTLNRTGDFIKFGYLIHEKDILATEYIQDMTLTACFKALKGFCGANWSPTEIWLSRKKPKNSQPYRKYFQAPISFDAPESAIVFQSDCLKQTLPSANPSLHQFLLSLITESKSASLQNLKHELANHISVGLFDNENSLIEIARRIGIHPRTLNRRLKELGTTFREIREHIRQSTACNLLRNTGMSISEVAAILGYSGSSSFNHAFRRWKDMSPRVWRKQFMAYEDTQP